MYLVAIKKTYKIFHCSRWIICHKLGREDSLKWKVTLGLFTLLPNAFSFCLIQNFFRFQDTWNSTCHFNRFVVIRCLDLSSYSTPMRLNNIVSLNIKDPVKTVIPVTLCHSKKKIHYGVCHHLSFYHRFFWTKRNSLFLCI